MEQNHDIVIMCVRLSSLSSFKERATKLFFFVETKERLQILLFCFICRSIITSCERLTIHLCLCYGNTGGIFSPRFLVTSDLKRKREISHVSNLVALSS